MQPRREQQFPSAQLICTTCGYKAKRPLMDQVACHGFRETASEPASCPQGHGLLERMDRAVQRPTPYGLQVVAWKKPILKLKNTKARRRR